MTTSAQAAASRRKGSRFELAVLHALQRLGFPWAEKTRAGYEKDHGDLHLVPGRAVIVQAKNRARPEWPQWLAQLERQRAHAGADHAVLVVKRRRAPAEDSLAVMRLADMARLLRAAGYGEPDDEEAA